MIADCCKISRSSRQVRRIRYTRADVRYVCADGHGCKVVRSQPKTTRSKAAGAAQQNSTQPLQAAATPCKTNTPADGLAGGWIPEPLEADQGSSSQSRLGGA